MKSRVALAAISLVVLSRLAHAQAPKEGGITPEEFEAKLGYQTGDVTLPGGIATIRLPESFRYLGPEGSRRLLTEAWGNPPEAADDVLGMLVPSKESPLSPGGWGVVITFDDDGYVNDSDAANIDYTKLLKEMQEGAQAANEERREEGFEPVTLVGWAEPPSYDANTHKLYWAKDLMFGDSKEHTLNYNIRILGRRGVLVLNAVAGMEQLPVIRSEARNLLSAVEFSGGHRYTDYLPGKDKAAAYGITGLIVGATAAKAGFFKALLVGLLAFKKVLFAGVIALGAALKRLLGRSTQPATGDAGNAV